MTRSIPIYLAVEDELSEWVARRILKERSGRYADGPALRRGGFGYLRRNIRAFNNMAKGCPVFLLTDLDKYSCPPELITNWIAHPLHQNLLFRVAVREVESWLLGDGDGLSNFLRLKKPIKIANPEDLSDPKEELLKHAQKSPTRQIRDALVWRDDKSGRLYQGPDYNGTLGKFVIGHWDVVSARGHCPSLDRLFAALQRLEASY
jgi:hypothetical protein